MYVNVFKYLVRLWQLPVINGTTPNIFAGFFVIFVVILHVRNLEFSAHS